MSCFSVIKFSLILNFESWCFIIYFQLLGSFFAWIITWPSNHPKTRVHKIIVNPVPNIDWQNIVTVVASRVSVLVWYLWVFFRTLVQTLIYFFRSDRLFCDPRKHRPRPATGSWPLVWEPLLGYSYFRLNPTVSHLPFH